MPSKSKGLGRGFDALIPENFDETLLAGEEERIKKVPLNLLTPNPEQPRKEFKESEISELANSIKRYGLLQPLIVTRISDTSYQLIAGERRWRAAQKADLKTIPVIVRTTKQLEQLEMALVENVQRVDLSPLEQAVSIQRLHEQFSQDYNEIAKRLGKALSTIMNLVRLLQLPSKVQEALQQKKITEGHARAILALQEETKQLELLGLVIANNWSVRQAERYTTAHKQGAKTTTSARRRVATTTPQTERLGTSLKTTVNIRRTAKGGKLEIGFKNETDLKRIIQRLLKK